MASHSNSGSSSTIGQVLVTVKHFNTTTHRQLNPKRVCNKVTAGCGTNQQQCVEQHSSGLLGGAHLFTGSLAIVMMA
jgi:hypothetical protein